MISTSNSSRGSSGEITKTSSTIMNTREKEKYIEEFDFPFCEEASKYEKIAKIGQGTFG